MLTSMLILTLQLLFSTYKQCTVIMSQMPHFKICPNKVFMIPDDSFTKRYQIQQNTYLQNLFLLFPNVISGEMWIWMGRTLVVGLLWCTQRISVTIASLNCCWRRASVSTPPRLKDSHPWCSPPAVETRASHTSYCRWDSCWIMQFLSQSQQSLDETFSLYSKERSLNVRMCTDGRLCCTARLLDISRWSNSY